MQLHHPLCNRAPMRSHSHGPPKCISPCYIYLPPPGAYGQRVHISRGLCPSFFSSGVRLFTSNFPHSSHSLFPDTPTTDVEIQKPDPPAGTFFGPPKEGILGCFSRTRFSLLVFILCPSQKISFVLRSHVQLPSIQCGNASVLHKFNWSVLQPRRQLSAFKVPYEC